MDEPRGVLGVATVHLGAELAVAYQRMQDRAVSALAVVGPDERPVGVLSMTDLLRVGRIHGTDGARPALRLPRQRVEQQMRRGVVAIGVSEGLASAARLMLEHRVHRVFVLDQGSLSGVISTRDLAEELGMSRAKSPVRTYATAGVRTVPTTLPLGEAIDALTDAGVSGLVVTDEGWPVGLFTQREALAARSREASVPLEEAMSFALSFVPEATPLWRAAAHASTSRARRVITVSTDHQLVGVVSGLDFARAYLAERPG